VDKNIFSFRGAEKKDTEGKKNWGRCSEETKDNVVRRSEEKDISIEAIHRTRINRINNNTLTFVL